MEFVTFHIALDLEDKLHPNTNLKHKEYFFMIVMMFASARKFHAVIKATLLTDKHTAFRDKAKDINVVRFDIDPKKLMLERSNVQLEYVLKSSFDRPLVFLDSDILLNSSLLSIFENEFDVAVTWRKIDEMPINGGFMILNNDRPEISKRFFKRFVTIYKEKYLDEADWYGDQLALRDCVGLSHSEMAREKVIEIEGCRVLLLPCDIYNFSPKNLFKEICSDLSGKIVLHFKGERKRLMSLFWNGWLKPRGSYLPWVHINGWFVRRWLIKQSAIEMLCPQEKS